MNTVYRAFVSELRKTFSTKTWWVLLIILIGYTALMAGAFSFFLSSSLSPEETGLNVPDELKTQTVYSIGNSLTYVIPLIFGTLLYTSEVRHATLTPTFLATPTRGKVFFGKFFVALMFGILYGVFQALAAVAPGAPIFALNGVDSQLFETDTLLMFARLIGATIFWVLLGLGIGNLITNQIAAIVILLVFTQFLDPILRMLSTMWEWTATVLQYLPTSASDAFVGSGIFTMLSLDSGGAAGASLTQWEGAAILAITSIVLMGIGYVVNWRKDVT